MRPELKLVPPKPGSPSPFYYVRGTYLGCYISRSTRTSNLALARKVLAKIKREIECGEFGKPDEPTFASAAIAYMHAGGEKQYVSPLLLHFGKSPLSKIDQAAIDKAADTLYPAGTAATRNRSVYTPISAILRHAGVVLALKRPRGAQGSRRTAWLRPDEAKRFLDAAWDIHPRFAALLTFLLYTGCRLSEALRLTVAATRLDESFAEIGVTKNGEPRGVHLPPIAVAAIRRALWERINPSYKPLKEPRATGRIFALTKSAHLYELFARVEAASGVVVPDGVSFHIFRHTYGAWARRYGKIPRLEETGAWTSRGGAKAYDHFDVSEAARAADLFPGAGAGDVPDLKAVK